MTKRTPAQVLRSLDSLASDLVLSGMRAKAKRLRRYRTEIAGFLNIGKLGPRKIQLSAAARRHISDFGLERYFADLL